MENLDVIRTCSCDDCGRRGPAVELHDRGEPVYALCATCAPKLFERVARRDIDAWLGAGDRVQSSVCA